MHLRASSHWLFGTGSTDWPWVGITHILTARRCRKRSRPPMAERPGERLARQPDIYLQLSSNREPSGRSQPEAKAYNPALTGARLVILMSTRSPTLHMDQAGRLDRAGRFIVNALLFRDRP